jgi:FAD:protein FMN transferase
MTRRVVIRTKEHGLLAACFEAMASPCEVLFATDDAHIATQLGEMAATEAWRIEDKYSRYRSDSIVTHINRSQGSTVTLDDESSALLDYAKQCYQLSEGRFDITSGILRRIWNFKLRGRDQGHVPAQTEIESLLPLIGFDKLAWNPPQLTLPAGMEVDFGGIGKEYAVDRVFRLLQRQFSGAVLVNFGGDLCASAPPKSKPWRVGIERPEQSSQQHHTSAQTLVFYGGGLATSGNTHRYFIIDDVRYGHILDPRTGWPVCDAPLSVTVAAQNCTMAGMLCTFAMLHGEGAEHFLEQEGMRYWCFR